MYFTSRQMPHLKPPVYLLRKHLNIDSLTRVQVILMSKNGTDWEEFKKVENQDAKNIRVEVSHFCWVTTISEPYKDTFVVGTKGAKLKSTKDERVTLEVPEDAVHCQQKVTLEVHECSYNTVYTAIPTGGEVFDVSFRYVVYLNREKPGNLKFKKKVVLTIPLPQNIPNADTAVCILKDEADNDEWQNITNPGSYDIKDDVLKLEILSVSGYAVGRYIKGIMPSMHNMLTKITKFKKSQLQRVQILLLQDKNLNTRMECHVIEDIGRSIEDLVKSARFAAFKNHRYKSNILLASADVIRNYVTGDFNLVTNINECVYYPYCENHWEALVEPKDGCQHTTMKGLMTFHKDNKDLAEFIFSTQSERKTPEDIASTTQNRVRYDYSSISNLRCLFLDMGKKLDRNQERDLRFLLRDEEIPRGELQNLENAAEIFENLKEKKGTEDTLKLLKEVFTELKNNTLVTMVEDYQQQTQCV
ncbi:uncharacterized protein [Ptychodera flava]|uniref:uncharacterized protein n=1 Tax=Ptychodera flava TaxID=63121 RepID=UPI00396A422C